MLEWTMPDDPLGITPMTRLPRAVWSLGDTEFHTLETGLVWAVSGVNGENQIRAERVTSAEA
jgi:hypothetical protein